MVAFPPCGWKAGVMTYLESHLGGDEKPRVGNGEWRVRSLAPWRPQVQHRALDRRPSACFGVAVIRDFDLFTAHWLLAFYLRVTGETVSPPHYGEEHFQS